MLLLQINWIPFLVLAVVLLAFVFVRWLEVKRVNWTLRMIVALVLGALIGVVFASEDNAYMTWVDLMGDVYIQVITLLVAPVILLSITSGFISLGNRENMKTIGLKSVFWLLAQSGLAILLAILVGKLTNLGVSAAAVFAGMDQVSDATVSAYQGATKSFTDVVLGLFPSNVLGDVVNNNVTGIIVIALALAVGYISVASVKGEQAVAPFKAFIEALKDIVFSVTKFIVHLTPYAVLALIASSASSIFSDRAALVQLALLVIEIYAVCLFFTYVVGGAIVRLGAGLNPVRFFKKIFPAQVTAFTTQSSIGTLPVTVQNLEERVGVEERIANFTAPLGTTIGMPGCTAVWPVLLALFFVNATGLDWGVANYVELALIGWFLSVGSAGVPGIAVVSAIALFNALGLPVSAVVLLIPINTISDMVRTMTNVSSAAIASAVVARQTGSLDDAVFARDDQAAAVQPQPAR